MRMRHVLLAPLVALPLAACGGGSSTPSTVPADADVIVRALDGVVWDAKSYSASAGEVTLYGVNDSMIAHNLYVLDASEAVVGTYIDLPSRGSNGTRVLDLAPGTYQIVCKIPGHSNMNSTLTVD
ncbi:MAG: hypothetical protein RLZ04_891 [Actinomycetota bacterium]|jgi:plastocyanin